MIDGWSGKCPSSVVPFGDMVSIIDVKGSSSKYMH